MAETVSVYDIEWGKFLQLSLNGDTLTVKITNNLDCILLFLFVPETSLLYKPLFDVRSGACTTAQSKIATVQLCPQFVVGQLDAAYHMQIILARTEVSRLLALCEIELTERSLMESFGGRRFYLSIVASGHSSARRLRVRDIELLEGACDERGVALSASEKQFSRPGDLNVCGLLQKALVILKARYQYLCNEGAEAEATGPYAQRVLKFKVSLDYWKYLTHTNRIAIVDEFLDFLKLSTLCNVCFGPGATRDAVFCGKCGAYMACCEQHAKKFAALHFSECQDFRALTALRMLHRADLELTVAEDVTSVEEKLGVDSTLRGPSAYADPARDKWIEMASDDIHETEEYLNEICDFAAPTAVQPPETDAARIEELIDESRSTSTQELDVQQSVDEMMVIFESVERERERFQQYLQTKYGIKQTESTPRVIQEHSNAASLGKTGASSDLFLREITLNDDVSRILDEFDYTSGSGFYAAALEKIQSVYRLAAQTLESNVEAYKLHRKTFMAQAEELESDLKENFEMVKDRVELDVEDHMCEAPTPIDANSELSSAFEMLSSIVSNKDPTVACDCTVALIDKITELEGLIYERQKQAQEIEKRAYIKAAALNDLEKRREDGAHRLDVCTTFSQEVQSVIGSIEACIYDQELYQRMKNRNSVNLEHLRKCPQNPETEQNDEPETVLERSDAEKQQAEAHVDYSANESLKTTISIDLKEKRAGLSQFESLERFSAFLTRYARQFNGINRYDAESYFQLLCIAQRAYSTVFVNMQRVLQRKMEEFEVGIELSFGDMRYLKRQIKAISGPPQLLRYCQQWCAIADEYETLQEEIERHVYYCMAYTPEVLFQYFKKRLQVPEINFARLDEKQAALLLDGVADL